MNEISDILGVKPDPVAQSPLHDAEAQDETNLNIDRQETEVMARVASTSVAALSVLRTKSLDFEREIRQLSQEMDAIDSRSSSLHHRLETREKALNLMEPLLQEYAVSSRTVSSICDGEMDAEWYIALDRIRKPITRGDANVKCVEGAIKLRRVLLLRAVDRAKLFYVARLRLLRRPGVNAQLVQTEMIQAGEAMELMRQEAPKLAASLTSAYKNTITWYYTLFFGKYGRWINRQPLQAVDTPKLLGSTINHSNISLASMSVSLNSVDSFSVGARPSILQATHESHPALPMSSSSTTPNAPHSIEVLVRSLLVTLADSFEIESRASDVMCSDRLPRSRLQHASVARDQEPLEDNPSGGTGSQTKASALSPAKQSAQSAHDDGFAPFTSVFDTVLNFYGDLIASWISQCSGDFFGLLLVVRLLEQSSLQAWIKPWINNILKNCWAPILKICQQQAASIEHAALMASTTSFNKQAMQGPHMLTQIVSTYISGALQLCTEHVEARLAKGLKGIVEAYELFISKLASGNEKVLYNNYFVMAALLSDIKGPLAEDLAKHFQLLVDVYSNS